MKMKRVLSLLLALVMTFSLLTLPSYAEDEDTAEETTSVETVTSAEDDFSALTVAEQYAALMAMDSEEEVYAALETLNEEQVEALTQSLTEEDILNLAHKVGVNTEEEIITPAANYTEVGPLMPPVNVAPVRKLAKAASAPMKVASSADDNGLYFDKKAEKVGDNYKITMEAYTTGDVKVSTKAVPTDIVLVLDESGSMADSMYSYSKIYSNSLNKDSNYYVKRGDSYVQVHYCTGFFTGYHDKWCTGFHIPILGHFGTEYTPMTSASDNNSSHVQFYTRTQTGTSKNDALIAAAKQFAQNVYNDAVANDVDHRIAVIGFSDNNGAETKVGLANDIRKNLSAVTTAINGLDADGGTYIEDGMTQAKNAFDKAATTSATTRNRIVIIFTDGIPGNGSWSSTTISNSADPAISTAKTLKNNYGATIYTIGMLDDADPELPISDETDNSARTNKFLHYLSSNYPNATSMSNGGTGSNKGYYLSASDTISLQAIFEKIQEEIAVPSISLNSEAVIKDEVSKYFKAPANATAISLYTADAKADGSFANRVSAPNTVKATVSGDTVSVTGFDFNKYFVSDKQHDGTYGKKLIIEFTVSPKDGFLGGNNVPTNGEAAIYDKPNGTKVEEQPSPEVNVPLANLPNLTANDKNIYLLGTAPTAAELGTIVKPTGADAWKADFVDFGAITADKTVSNTEDTTVNLSVTISPKYTGNDAIGTVQNAVEKKATAKVNVFKPEVNFKDSTIYQGATPNYATDNYVSVVWKHGSDTANTATMGNAPELTYTYGPVAAAFTDCTPVAVSSVKLNGIEVKNHTKFLNGGKVTTDKQFTVHVLQPTVTATVNDVQKYYGESYTLGDGANGSITVDWKDAHNHSNIPNAIGTKPYEANDLSLAYETNAFSGQTGTVPNKDFDVTVKVMKGTQVMPAAITTNCSYGCSADQTDGKYTVHVKTCTLTVKKSGWDSKDENQSFIFNVSGAKSMQVTVQGNGEAKIVGLPVGAYTVTEDGNWSWRYTAQGNGSATLSADNHDATVTITNNRTNNKWLSGDSYAINTTVGANIH